MEKIKIDKVIILLILFLANFCYGQTMDEIFNEGRIAHTRMDILIEKKAQPKEYESLQKKAQNCYNAVIVQKSDHVYALWFRAQIFIHKKQYQKAIEDCLKITEISKNRHFLVIVYGNIGWLLILEGKAQEAEPWLKKSYQFNPRYYYAYLNMGHALLAQGKVKEARKYYKKAILHYSVETIFRRDYLEAWKKWREDWRELSRRKKMKQLLQQQEKWIEQEFQKMDDKFSESTEEWRQIQHAQNVKTAAEIYSRSYEIENRLPDRRQKLLESLSYSAGLCFQKAGLFEQAKKYYSVSLELTKQTNNPLGMAMIYANRGTINRDQGNYQKAKKNYKKCLEIVNNANIDQHYVEFITNMGELHYQLGQYQKAIKYFNEAYQLARYWGDLRGQAYALLQLGRIDMGHGNFNAAKIHYEQALFYYELIEMKEMVHSTWTYLAGVYQKQGKYDKALKFLKKSLNAIINQKDKTMTFISIGTIYYYKADYNNVLDYCNKALNICNNTHGMKDVEAAAYNLISLVYRDSDSNEQAEIYIQKAIKLLKELKLNRNLAKLINNYGRMYEDWNKPEEALQKYQIALKTASKIDAKGDIVVYLSNIGSIYRSKKQYKIAICYYEKAFDIAKKTGNIYLQCTTLINLGYINHERKKYKQAEQYYKRAKPLCMKLKLPRLLSAIFSNLGLLYSEQKNYTKALKYHKLALEQSLKAKDDKGILRDLNNAGYDLRRLGENYKAKEYYLKAVEKVESILEHIPEHARREYFQKLVGIYLNLIITYIESGEQEKAYRIGELSRAKLLHEKLRLRHAQKNKEPEIPKISEIQSKLDKKTAILLYFYTREGTVQMIITQKNFRIKRDPFQGKIDKVIQTYQKEVEKWRKTSRIKNKHIKWEEDRNSEIRTLKKESELSPLALGIYYYHFLLGNYLEVQDGSYKPISNLKKYKKMRVEFARALYEEVMAPISSHITGKKKLIVVPDGFLGLLPFETLLDRKEKFLIESYQVRYSHSMAISHFIQNRDYSPERKFLIAFGAADYPHSVDFTATKKRTGPLKSRIATAINGGKSVDFAYKELEKGFGDIPGTKDELKIINRKIPGAKIISGSNVNEKNIRGMSEKGTLAKYKVLHFAVHGIELPLFPALSALVLSQTLGRSSKYEDNFLLISEIEQLKLKADFVNLAACQTATGQVYHGEGVVSLGDAFILAGANAVSSTLWKISDEGTTKFMAQFYDLVSKGYGYNDAMYITKKRFIKSKKYREPFYWAAFIYRGKNYQSKPIKRKKKSNSEKKSKKASKQNSNSNNSVVIAIVIIVIIVFVVWKNKKKKG